MFIIIWTVLAVVFVAYGLMIKALGTGSSFFLVWFGLGGLMIALAIATYFELWSKLVKKIKIVIVVLLTVFLSSFVIIEALVISHMNQKPETKLDYIVVLGAQVFESGSSAILRFRLDAAIDYLNENPDTICIVSGGQGVNEPYSEAEGMAKYLREKGIDDSRIIEERESKTTEQNIQNSIKFMRDDAKVGIVTNDFHIYRAVLTAKEQGLNEVSGIAAYSPATFMPNNLFREYFGMMKFLLVR